MPQSTSLLIFIEKKITFFYLRFLTFPFKSHYLRLQEVLKILILITIKVSQVLSALTLPFNILSKNINITCNIRGKQRNRVCYSYQDNQAKIGSSSRDSSINVYRFCCWSRWMLQKLVCHLWSHWCNTTLYFLFISVLVCSHRYIYTTIDMETQVQT